MKSVVLRKGDHRERDIERARAFMASLPTNRAYVWEVKEYRSTRRLEQNSYLWGVCYKTILNEGGEALRGWTDEDIHEYMLGEHFGWEVLEGFGKRRMKPIKRSSKLSTPEFTDFIDFVQRQAAQLGIFIPDAQ